MTICALGAEDDLLDRVGEVALLARASCSRRAANSAASLTSRARSAPGHARRRRGDRARGRRRRRAAPSACGCAGSPRGPSRSGGWTAIRRSKRPGRSSAGSRTSGRFVAAMTITLVPASKPSISVRIWFSVCSRSSWPPLIPPTLPERERPIASSSSMKMIAGAASLACLNRSRTREAPTPTIASTNSDAGHGEEAALGLAGDRAGEQRLAGARRAVEQHAARDAGAEALVALRVLEEVDDLDELVLGLVDAGDVVEGHAVLAARARRGARVERAEAAERAARRRLAARRARSKSADEQDRRAEAEEQRGQEAAARVRRLGVRRRRPCRRAALVSSSVSTNAGTWVLKRVDRRRACRRPAGV